MNFLGNLTSLHRGWTRWHLDGPWQQVVARAISQGRAEATCGAPESSSATEWALRKEKARGGQASPRMSEGSGSAGGHTDGDIWGLIDTRPLGRLIGSSPPVDRPCNERWPAIQRDKRASVILSFLMRLANPPIQDPSTAARHWAGGAGI